MQCEFGLTYYQGAVGETKIVVYGVIGSDRTTLPKDRHFKMLSKGRSVAESAFNSWIQTLRRLLEYVGEEADDRVADTVHSFHDTVKWARQIHTVAEKLIYKGCEKSFEDCINDASRETKSIYKAAQLLVDTFDTAEIYINPSSASFGRKRHVQIYKLVDKVRTILQLAEGDAHNKRLRMFGRSRNQVDVYESFKILPLALIQNAIKYAQTPEVDIHLDDIVGGVSVAVESTGPFIDVSERRRIFQKGYRGKWASKLNHDGVGLGLYVARHVAHAHGVDIHVDSVEQNYEHNGIQQALNRFSFSITSD